MKIGLCLSTCIRDIYDGKVKEHEVLVIISDTNMTPKNDRDWFLLWERNTSGGLDLPSWRDHLHCHDEFRRIANRLYSNGKIHQPNRFSDPTDRSRRKNYIWFDCLVPPEKTSAAAKEAWEHYKLMVGLSN